MPTKNTVRIGTQFRSVVADANVLFQVTKRVATGVYEAVGMDEPSEIDGRSYHSDFAGAVKVFQAREILASKGMEEFFKRSANETEDFFAGLSVGQTIHYHNGFNQFVRCQVVIAETVHSEGKKVKAIKPVALVGNWSKNDLPSRHVDGSVYNPYHVKCILEGSAFQPNASCICEAPGYSTRPVEQDPRTLPAIDLSVPPMTTKEEAQAKLWTTVNEVRSSLEQRNEDPKALLEKIRSMADAALKA